ncbi:uncharacterized protein METZ01_LOCUS198600, partial [marine metagenome]|jgi:putative Holliday junction resolvase|tara:strand:- start:68 stop:481 length:414 start_codon:yes stop_codon:yes gene_type:complete
VGRALGIDFGERRVGLALSDPMKIIASPFKTLMNSSAEKLMGELKFIIADKEIDSIVIGLPIGMQGDDTIQTAKVRHFAKSIAGLGIPIQLEDERLSTVSAIRSLTVQKVKTGHNKTDVDRTAAAIFLQQYLDKQSW